MRLLPIDSLKNPAVVNSAVAALIAAMVGVAIYGLLSGDSLLCVEALFLAFIPYIIWASFRAAGHLDFFAPDLGFPLAYIVYLFFGSIELPIHTQFGLAIPWTLWAYYIVGLVAYLAGVKLFRFASHRVASKPLNKQFWPVERFLSTTLLLFAIGASARIGIIAQSGLEIFHVKDEAARLVGAKGILAILSLFMEPATECLLLYMLVKKPSKAVRAAIILCMLLVGVNAIATTNRTGLLRILLAGVVVFHYSKKQFNFVRVAALGLFVLAFASALGTFRDVSQWGDQHIVELENQGFTDQTFWLMNGYDALRLPTETFYMVTQEIPEIQPFTYGKTSFAELGVFVPGHTTAPGEVVKNKLRLEFVGFGAAATILAPMWIDGGVVGIIAGMFLVGIVSQWLYNRVICSWNYVWILVYGWYMQNAFKAIKDDILPDIGVLIVIPLFFVVSYASLITFEGWGSRR